ECIECVDDHRLLVADYSHFLEIDAGRRQIFRDIPDVLVPGAARQDLATDHQERGRGNLFGSGRIGSGHDQPASEGKTPGVGPPDQTTGIGPFLGPNARWQPPWPVEKAFQGPGGIEENFQTPKSQARLRRKNAKLYNRLERQILLTKRRFLPPEYNG